MYPDPGWAPDETASSPVAAWRAAWETQSRQLLGADQSNDESILMQVAVRQGFVVTRGQIRVVCDANVLRRRLRAGDWFQVARGVTAVITDPAPPSTTATSDAQNLLRLRQRHVLVGCAQHLLRRHHVLSGVTAAIVHGLPTRRIPVLAQLTARSTHTPGARGTVLVRGAGLSPCEVTRWFGVAVTTVARTVVDIARHDGGGGLMAADAALREGLATRADLSRALDTARGWPGVRRARAAISFASPLAESPLESLTRFAMLTSGLPTPEEQVEIYDPSDGRSYRVDFLIRQHKLVIEADGRSKYSGDELWREKRRELALSRLGYRVERVIWRDVVTAWPATETRLRRAMSSSPLV